MNVTIITVSEDEIHYEGLYPYETDEGLYPYVINWMNVTVT